MLAGAASPVSFFAYPGRPRRPGPRRLRRCTELAGAGQDVAGGAGGTGRPRSARRRRARHRPASSRSLPAGALTVQNLAVAIAASLPEQARSWWTRPTPPRPGCRGRLAGAPRHDWLDADRRRDRLRPARRHRRGGGRARTGRCCRFEADGSAMYTIQALWTQAREQLNVTTVLVNNAAYAILRVELQRTAAGRGRAARRRAARPVRADPDFVEICRGHGRARRARHHRGGTRRRAAPRLRRARPAPDRGHRAAGGVTVTA